VPGESRGGEQCNGEHKMHRHHIGLEPGEHGDTRRSRRRRARTATTPVG
jgi:hypothetical protein